MRSLFRSYLQKQPKFEKSMAQSRRPRHTGDAVCGAAYRLVAYRGLLPSAERVWLLRRLHRKTLHRLRALELRLSAGTSANRDDEEDGLLCDLGCQLRFRRVPLLAKIRRMTMVIVRMTDLRSVDNPVAAHVVILHPSR